MNADPYFTIPVRIQLPATVYKRLERAAAAHEASLSDLVVELVRRALTTASGPQQAPQPTPKVSDRRRNGPHKGVTDAELEQIRDLHAQGMSDGKIGELIGAAQPTVSKWRRELLHLPAHHRSPNTRGKAS